MESQAQTPTEPYMRKYMREKYQADPTKARQYRNSCRIKAKLNINDADFERYGQYLADVVKLREIVVRIPAEHLQEVITPILQH